MQNLLNRLCSAEILEHDYTVDPIRLRVSRVLLYQYFERLCIDLRMNRASLGRRFRGKVIASVAVNHVLRALYSTYNELVSWKIEDRRRNSLHRHKKIGKR